MFYLFSVSRCVRWSSNRIHLLFFLLNDHSQYKENINSVSEWLWAHIPSNNGDGGGSGGLHSRHTCFFLSQQVFLVLLFLFFNWPLRGSLVDARLVCRSVDYICSECVCVCVCCAPLFGNDEKNIFFLSLYRILEPKSNVRTYQTTNKCGQRNK